EVSNGMGAVGIMHPKNRSLREYVGAAQARRMQVVAFDLGGTAEMAFDQQWIRISAECERGSVIHRDARNNLFGLADVGDNFLQGKFGATGHARHGEGCAHQLEEAAAGYRVEPL